MNYLSRLVLNHDPPDLCLLSNYNYRHEPQAPGYITFWTGLESRSMVAKSEGAGYVTIKG
jgi:hypothetical protein